MAQVRTFTAAAGLVAAVPVASWGLLGRQDEPSLPRSQLDYLVPPPATSPAVETALGVVALALAVIFVAVLVYASRHGEFDRRWWQVVLPLLVVGLVVGTGSRVVTAGVIGANIGAGLVIMLGVPLVLVLLCYAAVRGLLLRRRIRQ